MKNEFNTILIPVDFSINTDVAIAKAIELCPASGGEIHLFHIQRLSLLNLPGYLHHCVTGNSWLDVDSFTAQAERRLQEFKAKIANRRPGIQVCSWVHMGGPIEKSIAAKAKRIHADLIIIGKHSHHSLLPFLNTVVPSRLATASGVPVLTAKPGCMMSKTKTAVISITNQFPGTKLAILEAMHRKLSLQVYLVTFLKDGHNPSFSKQMLLNAIKMLKGYHSIPVEYRILDGKNKAKNLLAFCNKVEADVLIVYPDTETRVTGWINRHISDLLPANSRTQVFTVKPAY